MKMSCRSGDFLAWFSRSVYKQKIPGVRVICLVHSRYTLKSYSSKMMVKIAVFWLLAISGVPVLAQDAKAWYEAHPGMAHVKNVNQATHQIVDEFGRTRFFHGTNVVMKAAPWYRPLEWTPGVSSFGKQDAQNLRDLGVNIVRLGHHWAGAEPERGKYNDTFLEILKQQTKLAEEQGIYVLVDVHQDVLAKQLCGHGVPDVSQPPKSTLINLLTKYVIVVCQKRLDNGLQGIPISPQTHCIHQR